MLSKYLMWRGNLRAAINIILAYNICIGLQLYTLSWANKFAQDLMLTSKSIVQYNGCYWYVGYNGWPE